MKLANFGILSKKEMSSETIMSECPYLLIKECLYSMCGTVICLITVPNVEESGEFGGNFHNRHGSYLSWTAHYIMVNGEIGT